MAPSAADRRTYDRSRLRGSVELAWTGPDGEPCTAVGNYINISPGGLCIETPCEIPVGAELEVRSRTFSFPGPITVRNCRRCGPWFRIGLRFAKLVIESEAFREANKARM